MKISLQRPYIITKIDASALKTVLASTYQTAYRLYLITNGIKEVQSFYESENTEYNVVACIKTEAAAAGEAKAQMWNVRHLLPLLSKKPRYILRCKVTHKKTNKLIYRNEVVTIKPDTIYANIQECVSYLDNLLK